MKISKRILAMVLVVLSISSILTITAFAADPGGRKTGVAFVDASSLRLRAEPSTKSATLDYAYRNEVVVTLGKTGQWYHVLYNLQEGYMHEDYLEFVTIENVELGYGKVNGTYVNMRKGPATSYKSIGKSMPGDLCYIIGINKQWYKGIWEDEICYIRSDFLDLTEIPYENRDSDKVPVFFEHGVRIGPKVTVENFKNSDNYIGSVPPEAPPQAPSSTAEAIIATAKTCLGVRYKWGGESMSGFDCSGLVYYVFHENGITLGRTCKKQYAAGTPISKSKLQPGDLVFFQNTYTTGLSHVGIYIGDDQFIHASSDGVMTSSLSNSYWSSHYYGACRILTD
jgi:N-acetylmuramoyl-L-alanine amidase